MWKTYKSNPNGSVFMPSKSENIYSVIDLGTNTCLLLIASLKENRLTKIFEAQESPRPGKDLYKSGVIAPEKFSLVSGIFKNYSDISNKYDSEKIFAFGTSALREAKNSPEFTDFIFMETGIKIKIISGEDEAYYGYEGAVYDLTGQNYAVLDIGGGSTEISFRQDSGFVHKSFNIGSVRLHEKIFKENSGQENINKAKEFIDKILSQHSFKKDLKMKLAGIAGTLTTLSAIKNNLNEFDEDIIHQDVLNLNEITAIFNMLTNMTNDERNGIGNFMKGRSDIIVSGALILIEIMKYLKYDSVTVSTKGLRYGLLLHAADFNK